MTDKLKRSLAETAEQFQDLVAEAKYEYEQHGNADMMVLELSKSPEVLKTDGAMDGDMEGESAVKDAKAKKYCRRVAEANSAP